MTEGKGRGGNDGREIAEEVKRRSSRQLTAIGIAVFLVMVIVYKSGHAGLFMGPLSRGNAAALEIGVIAGFVLFSALNWRCPACGRYLGAGLYPAGCRKCGTRFE